MIVHRYVTQASIVVAAVVAFFTLGCSGNGGDGPGETAGIKGSPESAVKELFEMIDKQQWGRHWESIHPEQQKFIPKAKFVECAEASDLPRIDSVKVLEVYDEPTDIPGTGLSADSKALTVELKVSQGLLKNESRDTFHLIAVDGRWRWIVSDLQPYKDGKCPN